LADGRRRCARCRLDWRPGRLPLRLTPREWRQIVGWFVRDAPADAIARETGIHRKRVLRALTVVRTAIHRALTDEDALADRAAEPAASPVIGIRLERTGPSAEPVPGVDARRLGRRRESPADLVARLPPLEPYAAAAWRNQIHWVRELSEGERGDVSAFWAYVRRQLTSRGGRRRERLGLFLAEFTWRYRTRRQPPELRARDILRLIGGTAGSGMGLSGAAVRSRRKGMDRRVDGNGPGVNR
jgi:hypothetical protein